MIRIYKLPRREQYPDLDNEEYASAKIGNLLDVLSRMKPVLSRMKPETFSLLIHIAVVMAVILDLVKKEGKL